VIEVKTIKNILIMFVVQLFCNTMFSIHTFLCTYMFEYAAILT